MSARSRSLPKILGIQRLEHIDARARQQGVIDFKRRILRGRTDENQRPILDVGKKRILLRLVEAMHLVEKQNRVARAAQAARLLDHRADVLDSRLHRRQSDEFRMRSLGHQARQRGFAGARRAPQNHGMRMAGLERAAQRRTRPQQMRLSDELLEGLRAQPISQRPIRAVAVRHWPPRPITSTPGGGTKVNRSAANLALRFGLVKVNCVT